jgi:hypothetical protein
MMRDLWAAVELLHALLLVLWIACMPLLFWRRWPRLTRWSCVYAIAFVLISQGSHHLLGECFLTTLSRYVWERGAADAPQPPGEWFTVRLARRVFGMAPSQRAVVLAWEAGILVTAVGVLLALRRRTRGEGHGAEHAHGLREARRSGAS